MRVAIVDGHSTGRHLLAELLRRGVSCVHVNSSADLLDFFTDGFPAEDYEQLFDADDLPRLVDDLAALGVRAVVPGTESGVILAETLANALGLPGNPPHSSQVRRNKAAMMDQASAAGIAVPAGRHFSQPDLAARWYETTGLREAVVKPTGSAGSDNVWFCSGSDEVAAAGRIIMGSIDACGRANQGFLVQERLNGTEYYVNSVSTGGRHRQVEIWRYTKRVSASGAPLYDYEEPLSVSDRETGQLTAFTYRVLDALDVVAGASHTEIIVTERGPVLIEVGARLGGATTPWLVEKLSGVSQVSLLVESIIAPTQFEQFDPGKVRWSCRVRNVALHNGIAGTARSTTFEQAYRALPSAAFLSHHVRVGHPVPVTTDLLTSPGFMYLVADDPAAIERDYQRIRDLESAGVYIS